MVNTCLNSCLILSLEKSLSELGVLNFGAPQGSILSPLLFLLYVNDMKSDVTDCDLRLYADDTCLLSAMKMLVRLKKTEMLILDNSL